MFHHTKFTSLCNCILHLIDVDISFFFWVTNCCRIKCQRIDHLIVISYVKATKFILVIFMNCSSVIFVKVGPSLVILFLQVKA